MKKDFDYYKDLIEKKQLPEGFDQWLMTDDEGNTLAHVAVYMDKLLPDWTDKTEDWLIKDSLGNTIAHVAASRGILPPHWTCNTKNWLLKDINGDSIAHEAAYKGILPPDWTDKTEDWLTIAHVAAHSGVLPLNWTSNPENWLIKNSWEYSIGFLYSNAHKEHYNNPKTLEDYCKNMINHLYPLIYKKNGFEQGEINNLNNFLEPFLKCIDETTQKEWMKTSDNYSSFLIDYVDSIMNYIQDHLRFVDFIEGDDLILANQIKDNLDQTSHHLQNEKIKIKEYLFKQHEFKNQSIINENEIDLSRSL